ncbi:MAG TPA: HEPN domain-containing protein [Bryobacteraceae bacterium]|jgi:HEPN domain-containing protein|nr:HEPN domain-containing protein [Bryobacteraceae bacterium]
MTPDELRRDEARRWLKVAVHDLNAAAILREPEPSGSVFHSQQAAEKSAKALLAFYDVPFRRTHDLRELGAQCIQIDASLEPIVNEAADLTGYAVTFRYLDAPGEPDSEEAAAALAIARRVYEEISSRIEAGS